MGRLRLFLTHQRLALRSLFRQEPAVLDDEASVSAMLAAGITHPSQLCRCFVAPALPRDVLLDHEPGCLWVAGMCDRCSGTGWCVRCGGESARRIG